LWRSEAKDYDRDRKQLVGDSLFFRLRAVFPASAARSAVIGITDGDHYWAQADWRFAFGVKGPGYGVLSTARMDPVNFGEPPNDVILERRLRKMVTRYVGELYLGLPRNENPRSALGPAPMGVEELDAMTEELCPPRPGENVSC
jgi:predicted Zn-dependent protease